MFYPNCTIQTKVNVCSCWFCFEGDFLSCATEKGKILTNDGDIPSDDEELSDYDSDADSETENEDDSDDETELYELRAESVNSIITKNSTIALYSSTNSLESFYLCKVLDFGEAKETLTDKYNHIVEKVQSLSSVSITKNKRSLEREFIINYYLEMFLFFQHKCCHHSFI